jgi:hypothetical protein
MTKKINQKQALLAIANLERFEASALSGRTVPANSRPPYGRLNDVERFYEDTHNSGSPVYVVYSYGTPIAWHVLSSDEWQLAGQKFSPTTSRHQSIVNRAIPLCKYGKEVAA